MRFYIAIVILLMLANMISVFSLIFIERKDPTTTWAWLLILMLIPGIGFIIYLLLGQNLSRQKIFREKKIIDKTRAAGLEEMQEIRGIKKELQDEYSDLILMNYNHCGSIYTTGNEVKTYISGEKKFQDLIKDIRAAKKFIHIEYYIFRFDDLGKAIINELKEKVDEGLEVRLLVDGMGSKSLKQKEIRYIKSLGIKFSIFFPGAFPRINTRINYRNHRKIVVIDGEIGYVGGFNVGNEYVNRGHQFKFWRDTHLKVKGQAVDELNKRFILDWDYASDENLDNIIKYFEPKFNTPFEMFYSLSRFFDEKGYFNRNIGNNEYYKVFLDFNSKIIKEDNHILRDIIRYDYLNSNKRRGMPEFLVSKIAKEEEEKIKEKYRGEYSFRDYYVEKFCININKFIQSGEIEEKDTYMLFGYEENVVEIFI